MFSTTKLNITQFMLQQIGKCYKYVAFTYKSNTARKKTNYAKRFISQEQKYKCVMMIVEGVESCFFD